MNLNPEVNRKRNQLLLIYAEMLLWADDLSFTGILPAHNLRFATWLAPGARNLFNSSWSDQQNEVEPGVNRFILSLSIWQKIQFGTGIDYWGTFALKIEKL